MRPSHTQHRRLSGAASLLAGGISIVGDTLTAEGFAFGIFAYRVTPEPRLWLVIRQQIRDTWSAN
jgi:hypothetical protein